VALFQDYRPNSGYEGKTPVSWFQTDTGHYLFNTKVDVMKNHFSGLMVVKANGNSNYRVVMITETGLKILDMEFFPDREVMVHYVMEAFDRKALIKTLSNDLSLILMNKLSLEKPFSLTDKNTGDAVYKYKYDGERIYYHLMESGHPHYVRQIRGITNKVQAHIYGRAESGIDSISMSHYNFNLKISLYRIIEETGHADQ